MPPVPSSIGVIPQRSSGDRERHWGVSRETSIIPGGESTIGLSIGPWAIGFSPHAVR
jgi:hypothetical protein